MTYQKPSGLHESSYTIGEKIVGFQRQLLLLREALVRTTINPVYYPDLFRALRVLIIDGKRGRLGELAELVSDTHTVQSRAPVSIEPREGSTIDPGNDKVTFPRTGLSSVFFPNYHSRWFTLRGVRTTSDKSPISVDFWDHIESDVVAFKPEFGAEITRQTLIAEVCNTRDVAHASDHYPTFLRFTNAFGSTAPYFLEIAQEVAYEVLAFGRHVVNTCSAKYQNQVSRALQHAITIPVPLCAVCHKPIAVDEFVCPHCTSTQLPPPQRRGPQEQLASLFHFGRFIEKSTGTVPLKIDLPLLTYDGVSEYSLVDIVEGTSRMLLKRTGDMKLLWRVDRDLVSHSATWDLTETPEENQVVFFFTWSPEQITIISTSRRGGLWEVASDGTSRRLDEQQDPAPTP